ncbi:MAG: hypothetical protein OEY34_07890 [Cyclobacteriaceae bacterium]|nr:hypothetical protein [Cyclobacteriaceae bacterium]
MEKEGSYVVIGTDDFPDCECWEYPDFFLIEGRNGKKIYGRSVCCESRVGFKLDGPGEFIFFGNVLDYIKQIAYREFGTGYELNITEGGQGAYKITG